MRSIFLLRSRDLLEHTPWLLAQGAAVLAAPELLEPSLRSILRRAAREDRRAVRRRSLRAQVDRVTGKARREQRRIDAHVAAQRAAFEASRTDASGGAEA
jgi:hypothetical protein